MNMSGNYSDFFRNWEKDYLVAKLWRRNFTYIVSSSFVCLYSQYILCFSEIRKVSFSFLSKKVYCNSIRIKQGEEGVGGGGATNDEEMGFSWIGGWFRRRWVGGGEGRGSTAVFPPNYAAAAIAQTHQILGAGLHVHMTVAAYAVVAAMQIIAAAAIAHLVL